MNENELKKDEIISREMPSENCMSNNVIQSE